MKNPYLIIVEIQAILMTRYHFDLFSLIGHIVKRMERKSEFG
jgi:hypothetical protein